MAKQTKCVVDIAIIGSGIACTATLIAIFEKLLQEKRRRSAPFKITVIERYQELWKGIPYGERSSVNALTITTIRDFFTSDKEREKFFTWFIPNMDVLLKAYADAGGTTAAAWLADNKKAIKRHDWNNIYLPRHIVGKYITYKLDLLRKQVESSGLAKIVTIQGEAKAVKQTAEFKTVVVNTGASDIEVAAKKIVLAIGSAPERKLTDAFDGQNDVLYINNLHAKSLEDTADAICKKLASATAGEKNVLILGSNASSIELLYILNNTKTIADLVESITLLSLGGKLPGNITYKNHGHDITATLDQLSQSGSYTLDDLLGAATADILNVSGETVSVPDVDKIMGKTINLLAPLDNNSKKLFYAIHGVQLARLFRRSGTDYKKASSNLAAAQKLNIFKGSYLSLKYNTNGSSTLAYKNEGDVTQQLTKVFKVVVNCMGAEDLQTTTSPLIKDLIENNSLKVNLSNKAFEVSHQLEAAPGIYVIGPLAGGNFNKLLYFWHLENTSRIIYLSEYLAAELLQ